MMGADKPADSVTGRATSRLKRLAATDWKSKARDVASSIKAEYEAGKQGDEAPAKPIWATPQQQLDGLLAVFRQTAPAGSPDPEAPAGSTDGVAADSSGADQTDDATDDATDAADVAAAIRGVDWAGVRAAAAGRTTEASKAMKSMADHVDWGKVQPVAAQVSSALIAAIATGQLGVGGRLASTVARTITNQNGLGQRVAEELDETSTSGTLGSPGSPGSIDFRNTIEAAARET